MLLELFRCGLGTTSLQVRHETQVRDDFLYLEELSNRHGRNYGLLEAHLTKVAELCLMEARHLILNEMDCGNRIIFVTLQKLADSACMYGPNELSEQILFATHMLQGLRSSG